MSPREKAIKRQIALRKMCYTPEGKLTREARVIGSYLYQQCGASGDKAFPVSLNTGMVDPLAMAREAGRREIFDILAKMLNLTVRQRLELNEEKL